MIIDQITRNEAMLNITNLEYLPVMQLPNLDLTLHASPTVCFLPTHAL